MKSKTMLALALVLAACSDSADTAEKASDAVAAAPRELIVKARDFAFEAADTIQAGVTTIRLQNEGPELHHVALLRLEQGKTKADLLQLMASGAKNLPDWAVEVGGPNTPNGVGESKATVGLAAGSYLMVCFIPSADGMPHIAKGMMRELVVVPATTPTAPLPSANIVMTLHDYTFTESAPLTAGHHTIRVENQAEQSHEVVILKLEPGKTVEEALGWLEKMAGPPPMSIVSGTTSIDKGEVNVIDVELTAGEYVLVCLIPDVNDGKPHVAHGMVKPFTVG